MSAFRFGCVAAGCLLLAACAGGPESATPKDPAEIEASIAETNGAIADAKKAIEAIDADVARQELLQQRLKDEGKMETQEGKDTFDVSVQAVEQLKGQKAEQTQKIADLESKKKDLDAALAAAKSDVEAERKREAERARLAAEEEKQKAEAARAEAEARQREEEAKAAEAEAKKKAAEAQAAEAQQKEAAEKAAAEAKKKAEETAAVEAEARKRAEAAKVAVAAAESKSSGGAKAARAQGKAEARSVLVVQPHTTEDYLYEDTYESLIRAIRDELAHYEEPLPSRRRKSAE